MSYCFKMKKVVILLSTQHHDKSITNSTGDKKKPNILTYYNSTKGTVDRNDKSMDNYCERLRYNCWTMKTSKFLIDAVALNYIICLLKLIQKSI